MNSLWQIPNVLSRGSLVCIKNLQNVYIFEFFFNLFGCAGSLLLHRLFSSCGEWWLFSSWSAQASHCGDFSCCGAQALGHAGFSSCGTWAPESRFNSCGTWAQLLCDMWDLPRPRIEHVSPALAGEFFTTEPSGKPWEFISFSFSEMFITFPRMSHSTELKICFNS